MITIPKLRWLIAALLLAATMINYIDRLTLSIVITDLRKELSLSEADYSQIVSAFLLAYAIMYAGSGYIVDRLGTRRGFAVFISTWSAAQMLHAAARGKWSLAGCRFLLGLTEPGNFPAAVKAVREWFPPAQRALGVGICNAGSSLGSAAAAPMTAFLVLRFGWRFAFVASGCLGLIWLAVWLVLYQPPHRNRWLSRREFDASCREIDSVAEERAGKIAPDWRAVLRMRACYTLIVARFLTDPVVYFIIFWLPDYLRKERAFNLASVGAYAWVPFLLADAGYIVGGWLSGHLIRRGWPVASARKFVMLMGACLLPAAILAPLVRSSAGAIAATSVVLLGHGIWIANLLTLPADLFAANEVGTVTGFSGAGGATGGILATLATGYVVAKFSYMPIFVIAGLMHPLGILITYALLRTPRAQGARGTAEAQRT